MKLGGVAEKRRYCDPCAKRTDGSADFYREWEDYEKGFGLADGEYFVGLGRLHALTSSVRQELLILMEDYEGEQRYELYNNFRVGGKAKNYTLESVGSFSGTAGDSLTYHKGMQFSTKDRDNDIHETIHCAQHFKGAWWYRYCQL
ncbi:ryncolin-4-like, partial [Drosophila serrata]|uniref:ryncolin-4-like n=1 Tax=Drosophila serrata TaxID=7274 RepID=UPI000A1CF810